MNYNILAYVIYIAIMVFIIVFVGKLFHKNGRVFIVGLFKGQVTQADNLLFCPYSLDGILAMLERYFNNVGSYWAYVPSFGGFSGFAWASHSSTLAPELPHRASGLGLRYLSPEYYKLGLGPLPAVVPMVT